MGRRGNFIPKCFGSRNTIQEVRCFEKQNVNKVTTIFTNNTKKKKKKGNETLQMYLKVSNTKRKEFDDIPITSIN